MIPVFKPSCSDKEISYVTETLKSGWWGLGPKVEEFEEKFADYVGAKYAVGLNSATSALHLALKVHKVQGQVVIPALTFVSTGLAVLYNNCEVVFGDVDEETLCLKPTDGETAIPVHYAGREAVIGDSKLVIEDCAHAMGNKKVGNNTSCWSFHAVKNLATGDGGMITTNDRNVYEKLLSLRWCGIDSSTWERSQKKYGWDYSIDDIGYKYHMNDLTAAIGLAQLERIEELNDRRKLRVLQYLQELKNLDWLKLPDWDADSSWHMFVVRMKNRDRFIDYLLAHGISAGVHYKPLNTYPIFPQTKLPVTDRVWKTLVTLPLYPDMTNDEFEQIIKAIKDYE